MCAGALPDGAALPAFLQGKRVMQLDLGLLIAGAKERGELESRVTGLLSEIRAAGDVVLMCARELAFQKKNNSCLRQSCTASYRDPQPRVLMLCAMWPSLTLGARHADHHAADLPATMNQDSLWRCVQVWNMQKEASHQDDGIAGGRLSFKDSSVLQSRLQD